jgi:hypothetical protein
MAMAAGLVTQIDRPERPTILADRQGRRQFGSRLDPHVPAERHGALDDDLVVAKTKDLHSPDQIRPGGMSIGFVGIVIGMGDRDLDRSTSLRDLLEEAFPLVGSTS